MYMVDLAQALVPHTVFVYIQYRSTLYVDVHGYFENSVTAYANVLFKSYKDLDQGDPSIKTLIFFTLKLF